MPLFLQKDKKKRYSNRWTPLCDAEKKEQNKRKEKNKKRDK
jgi:hypothetical protein